MLLIEEFAHVFCFGYAIAASDELDICGEITKLGADEYDDIFRAVQTLGILNDRHREMLRDAISEMFKKKEIFASKNKFMCFVMSRCVRLSENPSLFSFLVVCIFIDNVLFRIFQYMRCFTMARLAAKCLVGVYYREYEPVLTPVNGIRGFNNYCAKLNATVLGLPVFSIYPLDLKNFSPPDIDEVAARLGRLKNMINYFVLDDMEEKMLYDRSSIPVHIEPSDDILIPQHYCFATEEVRSMAKTLNLGLSTTCLVCLDNCFKIVIPVAKELRLQNTKAYRDLMK